MKQGKDYIRNKSPECPTCHWAIGANDIIIEEDINASQDDGDNCHKHQCCNNY